MPKVILFDIDYTLINTKLIKENCRNSLIEYLNISTEKFEDLSKNYVKSPTGFTDFNPYEYIKHLSSQLDESSDSLARIYFSDKNFSNTLYTGTESVLEDLNGKFVLGIFSEGHKDFQILKLHKTGILKYFDSNNTFIFRRKLIEESLELLPVNSFIVDDNLSVLEALNETRKFKPIWLNRKSKEKNTTINTIFNLTQLKNYLGND